MFFASGLLDVLLTLFFLFIVMDGSLERIGCLDMALSEVFVGRGGGACPGRYV